MSHSKESLHPALPALLDQALHHPQTGQLTEAEQLYRHILTLDPRHADSLHLLGVLAHQVERLDIASDMEAAYREMWQRWCVQNGQEKHTQGRQ